MRALDQMRREDAMRDFTQSIPSDTEFNAPGEWPGLDTSIIGDPDTNPQILSMHNHYVQAMLDAHQVLTTLRHTLDIQR